MNSAGSWIIPYNSFGSLEHGWQFNFNDGASHNIMDATYRLTFSRLRVMKLVPANLRLRFRVTSFCAESCHICHSIKSEEAG